MKDGGCTGRAARARLAQLDQRSHLTCAASRRTTDHWAALGNTGWGVGRTCCPTSIRERDANSRGASEYPRRQRTASGAPTSRPDTSLMEAIIRAGRRARRGRRNGRFSTAARARRKAWVYYQSFFTRRGWRCSTASGGYLRPANRQRPQPGGPALTPKSTRVLFDGTRARSGRVSICAPDGKGGGAGQPVK
jgi:hypothetical protein